MFYLKKYTHKHIYVHLRILFIPLFFITSSTSIDDLSVVTRDRLDQTLRFEFTNSNTSQGTIKLKTVNQNGLRNELVSRDFLKQTFISRLIKNNQVVGLILNFLSGPLLLGFLSTRGRARLGSNVFLCLM